MLGAYIGWSILTRLPRDPASFALGVLAAAVAPAAVGALLEMALLRRIYRAPELFQLLATFGVVLIVQDATLRLWGPHDLASPARRGCAPSSMLGDALPRLRPRADRDRPAGARPAVAAVHPHPLGHAGARRHAGPRDGGRPRRGPAAAVHLRVRAGRRAGRAGRGAVAARRLGQSRHGPVRHHRRLRGGGRGRPRAACPAPTWPAC